MLDDTFLFIIVAVLIIILLLVILAIVNLYVHQRRRQRRAKNHKTDCEKMQRLPPEEEPEEIEEMPATSHQLLRATDTTQPSYREIQTPPPALATPMSLEANQQQKTSELKMKQKMTPSVVITKKGNCLKSERSTKIPMTRNPSPSLQSTSTAIIMPSSEKSRPALMPVISEKEEQKVVQQEDAENSQKAGLKTTKSLTMSTVTTISNRESEEDHVDFDAIYNTPYESDGNSGREHRGNILWHLLSQLTIGMDLSKVRLPTHVLERRSLFEMYADFFVHPDDFVLPATLNSSEERFLAVLRYYLNSFLPARRTDAPRKPYNPVLGEIFRCKWTQPGTFPADRKTANGPWPGTGTNQVTFIGEQVSHHPPVSAFYAEHPESGVSFNGQIYTKSSFLGFSIGVYNIGSGTLTLKNCGEHYTVNFPNAFCRSIMTTPWIELGGKVKIRCLETQYRAEINFLTKGPFGGKPHQINGKIFRGDTSKKPIMRLKGEWKTRVYIRAEESKEYRLFTDVLEKPDVRKECVPVMEQGEKESRKVWRHVTAALFHNDIEAATEAKKGIEQCQREERDKLAREGGTWTPRFFVADENEGGGGHGHDQKWHYVEGLPGRSSI